MIGLEDGPVRLELSSTGVAIASRRVPSARFLQRDLLQPADDGQTPEPWATHSVCSEVLEHLDDPQRLLVNAHAWMAPACKLIVTVPGGPMSAFDRAIGHRRHFTPHALRRLLEDSGFRVQWTRRSGFPFFNLYRLVVIARGERLARDVHAAEETRPTVAVAVMSAFDRLFRFNLDRTPFGWQIMALATLDRPG